MMEALLTFLQELNFDDGNNDHQDDFLEEFDSGIISPTAEPDPGQKSRH